MTEPDPNAISDVVTLAELNGIAIPEPFRQGVAMNAALLQRYAALVHGLVLPDSVEPAYEYVP